MLTDPNCTCTCDGKDTSLQDSRCTGYGGVSFIYDDLILTQVPNHPIDVEKDYLSHVLVSTLCKWMCSWTLAAPRVLGNTADVIWPRSRDFVFCVHARTFAVDQTATPIISPKDGFIKCPSHCRSRLLPNSIALRLHRATDCHTMLAPKNITHDGFTSTAPPEGATMVATRCTDGSFSRTADHVHTDGADAERRCMRLVDVAQGCS
jgi:hypothetical protein